MTSDKASDALPDISKVHQHSLDSSFGTFGAHSLVSGSSAKPQHPPKNLADFSTLGWQTPRNVRDFIKALDTLNVEGPLTLTERLEDRFKLGEGGQFTVYRNAFLDDADCSRSTTLDAVAVKKCIKFQSVPGTKTLDLQSPEYRTQVHDMLLEVAALRAPGLHKHRNIVELIGYGVEMEAWHETPFLVMELAIGDLSRFLSSQRLWEVLQQLCLDVGSGLDVIHLHELVHGDLKPLNILVFPASESVSYVAKLADFGFSTGELDYQKGGSVKVSGCSHGWAAPEVERHLGGRTQITVTELLAADNFAYGLLILSCLCCGGKVVPYDAFKTSQSIEKLTSSVPDPLRRNLITAASSLLRVDYTSRPQQVGDLLKDGSEACAKWLQIFRDFELKQPLPPKSRSSHVRELPSLDAFFFEGIDNTFLNSKSDLTGPQLLAMYLYTSYRDAPKPDKSLQIEMLLESSRRGYPHAQGIAQTVLRSYGLPVSDYVNPEEAKLWLFNAVSTGSFSAHWELAALDPELAQAATNKFRDMSGFNQPYSFILGKDPLGLQRLNLGDSNIRQLAEDGKLDALKSHLDLQPQDINVQHASNETALCKACMAGHTEVVLELCKRGADASLTHSDFAISCLHWLFNFPASDIKDVLHTLLAAGSKVNHSLATTRPLINNHYPFTWPPGTPLHWAVVTSSRPAISALMKAGANPSIRNGDDPYFSDENVRQLHRHGNTEQGESSETPDNVLGMTPVDLATLAHDWQCLHAISPLVAGKKPSLLSADEEGYTPFHRLSHQRIGRTFSGSRFWYPAFKGDISTRRENLRSTIEWLKALGGDIDQLTDTPRDPGLSGVDGLSPLMIAVTKYDIEAVEALCEADANVNLRNRSGRTALTLLDDAFAYHANPSELLPAMVSCLVKHGADPNFQSPEGLTPLACMARVGDVGAFQLLFEAGADVKTRYKDAAVMADLIRINATARLVLGRIKKHDVEERDRALSSLLLNYLGHNELHADFVVDDTGATLLHYCAAAALPKCTAMLVSAGATIGIRRTELPGKQRSMEFFLRDPFAMGTPKEIIGKQIQKFLIDRSNRLNEGGKSPRARSPSKQCRILTEADSAFIYARMKEVQRVLEGSGNLTKGTETS